MRSNDLQPALRLAVACCRAPGPSRDQAVRAAVAGVDGRRFGRVVARHRIAGLVHEALVAADVSPRPEGFLELRAEATRIAVKGLRLAAETTRLQGALDAAGIANLVLKGATLDILAWGRLGLKQAWDIDLLTRAADALGARRILEARGYRLRPPPGPTAEAFLSWLEWAKECVFIHPDTAMVVELHWRVTDAAGLLPTLSATSPWQSVALSEGLAARTLADEPLFAYLTVHGAAHGWSRLKWLADLGALLARKDEAGRERLYRAARALGAGNCPASALLLCERLLELEIPPAIAGEVRRNRPARRLADLAMMVLTRGGGETEIATRRFLGDRILLSHLWFADGWAYRWAEARRQSISVDDRLSLRLPGALGFLYPLARGPLWLARRFRRP